MPVLIKVSKVTSPKSLGYGKHYGHVVTTKTMSYQELCKHMAEHNSVYGEDVCLGVANKLQSCMLEQLLEGKKVQFGDLGTFYLSVKTKGEEKEEDFGADNIERLHLRLMPNHKHNYPLDSVSLRKSASFRGIEQLAGEDKENKDGEADGNEGA